MNTRIGTVRSLSQERLPASIQRDNSHNATSQSTTLVDSAVMPKPMSAPPLVRRQATARPELETVRRMVRPSPFEKEDIEEEDSPIVSGPDMSSLSIGGSVGEKKTKVAPAPQAPPVAQNDVEVEDKRSNLADKMPAMGALSIARDLKPKKEEPKVRELQIVESEPKSLSLVVSCPSCQKRLEKDSDSCEHCGYEKAEESSASISNSDFALGNSRLPHLKGSALLLLYIWVPIVNIIGFVRLFRLRADSIGWSRWAIMKVFIPVYGLWPLVQFMALPAGYQESKKLDAWSYVAYTVSFLLLAGSLTLAFMHGDFLLSEGTELVSKLKSLGSA